MAISFRKYVDITSGIGGKTTAKTRDLIGRIYTTNPLCPAGGILEFDYLEDVATFFGSDSEEYRRAAFYFSWISKTQKRAKKLCFCLWPVADSVAHLRALAKPASVEAFAAVADGSFTLACNDLTVTVTGCDFSGVASYADIAAKVQAALRKTSGTALIKQATVTFNPEPGTFTLTAGKAANGSFAPLTAAETGTFIGAMLGLDESTAVVAGAGIEAKNVSDTLNESLDASNNFGSFLLMGKDITLEEAEEAAIIAHASNMQFMLTLGVTANNYKDFYERLKGYSGVALTLLPENKPHQYHEMMPMIMLAATDYKAKNGTINYMYHQFGTLDPTVTTTPMSNEYDKSRVNYYGRTQQAGQTIDFYQRGVMLGEVQDMNIYANEMWLKDQAGVDVFNLLVAMPKISANLRGQAQIQGCLQNTINMALNNGAISVGKKLNYTQRTFVQEITGQEQAWRQVEVNGYWLNVWTEEVQQDDRTEYIAKYLLVYTKDDVIRKVEGTHSLM